MARTDPQVNVRLPEPLLERLRVAADANGASLTGEIVRRLEASFPKSFDLLKLEQRQRDLQLFRERLYDVEWRLLLREALAPDERGKLEAEQHVLHEELLSIQGEIDRMYASLNSGE
ncbi:Arc family DNA-binding protein [Lysobacter panacisoli]|uniref:Arc-like DNA binding domain-containing protein n=1 Tax=Lysobacter panacisoli TaxID=1255263 RepID=A0ABP9LCK5_9GAMM|nr:Arc family DNA-binding protein [Lysobacter panacisoli]